MQKITLVSGDQDVWDRCMKDLLENGVSEKGVDSENRRYAYVSDAHAGYVRSVLQSFDIPQDGLSTQAV